MRSTTDLTDLTIVELDGKFAVWLEGEELGVGAHGVVDALNSVLAALNDEATTLEELVERLTPRRVVSPAAAEQARRNAELRAQALEDNEMLDSEAVAALVGSQGKNRSATGSRLVRSHQAFAVQEQGRWLFPTFQFDLQEGRLYRETPPLVAALAERGVRGWSAVLWMLRRSGWLGGKRPVDLFRSDFETVLHAAEQIGTSGS